MINYLKNVLTGMLYLVLLSLAVAPGLVVWLVAILLGKWDWAKRGMRAYDNFGNATLLGGSPYQTISAHVGQLVWETASTKPVAGWAVALCMFLDSIDDAHTAKAWLDEKPIMDAVLKHSPDNA